MLYKLIMESPSLHLLPELIFVTCEGMFDCTVVMRSAVNINCARAVSALLAGAANIQLQERGGDDGRGEAGAG